MAFLKEGIDILPVSNVIFIEMKVGKELRCFFPRFLPTTESAFCKKSAHRAINVRCFSRALIKIDILPVSNVISPIFWLFFPSQEMYEKQIEIKVEALRSYGDIFWLRQEKLNSMF